MAIGKSKFDGLPWKLREQLNQKLLDRVAFPEIVTWLFGQANENASGLPCSELWTADSGGDMDRAKWNCQAKLYEYFKGREYTAWAVRNTARNEDLIFVERMESSLGLLGDEPETRLVRSVLMEVAPKIRNSAADPEDKAFALAELMRALAIRDDGRRANLKLEQNAEKIGVSKEKLALDTKKFQRQTVEAVRKAAADPAIQAILAGTGTNDEKTEQLGKALFGEDWNT